MVLIYFIFLDLYKIWGFYFFVWNVNLSFKKITILLSIFEYLENSLYRVENYLLKLLFPTYSTRFEWLMLQITSATMFDSELLVVQTKFLFKQFSNLHSSTDWKWNKWGLMWKDWNVTKLQWSIHNLKYLTVGYWLVQEVMLF